MACHSLISAAANSTALERSDTKCNTECRNELYYDTNAGKLDVINIFVWDCSSSGYTYKDKISERVIYNNTDIYDIHSKKNVSKF
jgi:hypothetical protein